MINLTDSLSACTASGILAYAKQIYHQMSGGTETNVEDLLNEHETKIQSAIKLNEYDEVNVTRPLREGHEGYILCHLEKNNEKIIQDHPDWGSEFVDYVSGHNVYIATDMGNTNIGVLGEDEFIGYTSGEEIKNVSDSSIKSVIVDCFPSDYDYWILETETELTINNMPYYGPASYYQTREFTPFHLQPDGSLYLMHVGGYNGDKSIAYQAQPLQTVLEQIASASTSSGVTSWNDLEDKPTILDSSDVRQIVLDKSPLHYDNNNNYVTFIPNGSSNSYTPNSLSGTSESILLGKLNTFNNTYNGVLLGSNNTTNGNKSSDSYDSTVIVGKSNTNNSKNSVLIGDYNNNNQDKSVMLGSSNTNGSSGGVNIGYYNQNNGGERNVMIGYDNYASNSASTLCIGSENRLTKYSSNPTNQEIIAFGRGLSCTTGGIFLGYYNVDDSVLTGDTANFLTIGDGSGTTRSNIIEQRRNGDIYIKGIGNYNGNNSRRNNQDPYRGKSLQEVLSGMSDDISDRLKIENKSLVVGDNETDFANCACLGVGAGAYGDRSFGFGEMYMSAYLTGNGDNGDEGRIYQLWLGKASTASSHTIHQTLAEEIAKTHVGSYLLATNNFTKNAQILKMTFNGQDQPLTVEIDTDLGTITNGVWALENVGSGRTFSVGGYGNIGQYGMCMGNYTINSAKSGFVAGSYSANGGQGSILLGQYNKNSQTGGNLIGTQNINTGEYSNVIGLQNDNSGQCANIIGISNNNKCQNTTIIGHLNDIKETTYPSCVVGYNNSGDTSTQQFTLGYKNHGTRGQYAPANASCTWMIGHDLITSRGGFAIGWYNKDYDVQDTDKQNFFVISQGDSNLRSNSFELKANGDLYVYGVGGFNGINSDGATVKTLQAKIAELEARIVQLEGGSS